MAYIYQTRRAFLAAAGALVAGAAIGATVSPQVAQADVLRPPGALPEIDFMARCNRCERCISVCPTSILKPMTIEEGFVSVRTPQLDFSNNSCTFCDLCRQVCPTQAI